MSLKTQAINQLTVAQIWDQGLLEGPFPPRQIDQLYARITLQSLYDEGLLNEDVDPDLLAIAVAKSIPLSLWSYLVKEEDLDRVIQINPFDPDAEKEAMLRLDISEEQFNIRRYNALAALAADLTVFLESPGVPIDFVNNTIVWERVGSRWKLVLIGFSEDTEEDRDLVRIEYMDTLDEMMISIYSIIGNSLISTGETKKNPQIIPEAQIPIVQAIRNSIDEDVESIWEMLQDGTIVPTSEYSFAIKEIVISSSVFAVGNYMYIVPFLDVTSGEEYNFNYIYYTKLDAYDIITAFLIDGNKWDYYPDPI